MKNLGPVKTFKHTRSDTQKLTRTTDAASPGVKMGSYPALTFQEKSKTGKHHARRAVISPKSAAKHQNPTALDHARAHIMALESTAGASSIEAAVQSPGGSRARRN